MFTSLQLTIYTHNRQKYMLSSVVCTIKIYLTNYNNQNLFDELDSLQLYIAIQLQTFYV